MALKLSKLFAYLYAALFMLQLTRKRQLPLSRGIICAFTIKLQ